MKKSLLFIGLAFTVAATAQNSRRIQSSGSNAKPVEKTTVYPEVLKAAPLPAATPQASTARKGNGGNNTTAVTEVAIGSSGNCFGPAFGAKTQVWYDKDINTVVYTHRSDNVNLTYPNSGLYLFDASTDGGSTWTINNLTGGDSANINRGRYPQGVIYNPSGNTDPANAYVTTIGPSNDGATAGFCDVSWNGFITGNAPVGGTSHTWSYLSCFDLGLNSLIPSGGTIVKNTGVSYFAVNGYDGTAYNDTISLIKGTWNSTTSSMDYSFTKLYVPLCTDAAGAKMYVDVNTAWNDAGDIGYITILGNDWTCNGDEPADSTYGLIVLKTVDGGANWTKLGRPWLSLLDPVLAAGDFFCTTAFEHDVAVDKNNNLHVAVAVGAFAGGGSISTGPGFWAIFDITTPDQGETWNATAVGRPMTFRGNYGITGDATNPAIPEDSRPQISRSWDGSKMFFTWFDTDTIVFGVPAEGNIFPDMFSIGLDVDANLWTDQVNHTQNSGTSLDGACHWGNVSYYTINNGTDECIPMVGGVMVNPPVNTGSPLNFSYIAGACMSNYVNTLTTTVLNYHMGTNDPSIAATEFSVSSNYPNPYTGKTSVDVTLAKAGEVTIEISNTIGQVLSTENYKNLRAGVNTLTIDGSSLSKGLYFYTVKAGNESATKTMSVD